MLLLLSFSQSVTVPQSLPDHFHEFVTIEEYQSVIL